MLGNGEKLIKQWDYAKSKKKVKHSLMVTNKRIIQESRSKKRVDRTEMPIEDAKRITIAHERGFATLKLILTILGVLLLGVGLFLGIEDGFSDFVLLLPAIAGLVSFIIGICLHKKGGLCIHIYAKQYYEIGLSTVVGKSLKAPAKLKFKVNNAVAKEIVDQLGAIVFCGDVQEDSQCVAGASVPDFYSETSQQDIPLGEIPLRDEETETI